MIDRDAAVARNEAARRPPFQRLRRIHLVLEEGLGIDRLGNEHHRILGRGGAEGGPLAAPLGVGRESVFGLYGRGRGSRSEEQECDHKSPS
jgi:hypothetical protein